MSLTNFSDDGIGIDCIVTRYGFKDEKQAWDYLESIGLGKETEYWEPRAIGTPQLQLEPSLIGYIDEVYYQDDRQLSENAN